MVDQRKAYLYGLGAVFLWSTVATAFKLSLRHLPPAQLLLYAAVFSTLTLGAILAVRGRFLETLAALRRDWRQSLGLGLLNPFLYYLVLFRAYDLLPAQEAQPLNYTWAITLSLLSVPLLKQRIAPRDLVAILVSYLGVVVISTKGDILGLHFAEPVGVALALGSTVIWALYWIYNTKSGRDPLSGLFRNFLCSLPLILAWCLLFTDLQPPPLPGLAGAAYVGVFEMGVTYVLWQLALDRSENTAKVGNLIFLSPFLSLVFIHLLVGETILPSTLVGLVLIVCGQAIQQLRRRRRRTPPA
jgi:drug/metabolite transporter (DMT)-like permease